MPAVDEDFSDDWPPFNLEHYRHHTPAGPNPSCPNCKHLNWSQPVDVNDYIRGLADEELKAELYRRNDEKQQSARERMELEYQARQRVREERVRGFCEDEGITVAQFEAVEEYLEQESETGW